jgi:hypothetical protein
LLNVLLYLNQDWDPRFGGSLLVRRNPAHEPMSVPPLFNRGVVMLTGDDTYHGYRRMTLPPGSPASPSRPTPTSSSRPAACERAPLPGAPEDAGILKRTLARNWTSLAATRDRMLRRR